MHKLQTVWFWISIYVEDVQEVFSITETFLLTYVKRATLDNLLIANTVYVAVHLQHAKDQDIYLQQNVVKLHCMLASL